MSSPKNVQEPSLIEGVHLGVQYYFFYYFFLRIPFNFQNVPPYQYILSLCILKCLPSLSLCCLTCSNELLPPTSLLSLPFCCLKCWTSRNVVSLYWGISTHPILSWFVSSCHAKYMNMILQNKIQHMKSWNFKIMFCERINFNKLVHSVKKLII